MNNTPIQITEADVVAFLTAKAAQLGEQTGEQYASVKCEVLNACHGSQANVRWATYVNGDKHRNADSLDAVFNEAVHAMAPVYRANALRENAAKLLAEAAALESVTAPALQSAA